MKPGFYITSLPACFGDSPTIYGVFEWRSEENEAVWEARHALRELNVELPDAYLLEVHYRGRKATFEDTEDMQVEEAVQLALETEHTPLEISEAEFLRILALDDTYRTDCANLEVCECFLHLAMYGKYCGMKFGTRDLEGL